MADFATLRLGVRACGVAQVTMSRPESKLGDVLSSLRWI